MRNIFVISDLHLGHKNMAIYRGFKSVEEHDNHIINMWNSVVNKGDTVWILGDIGMEKKNVFEKLSLLNGYKKVLLGNHELCKKSHNIELLKYVNCIGGCVVDKKGRYILSHIPVHPSQLKGKCINIHGHIHENKIDDDRYINVSCEAVNYTPKLLLDLINKNFK